MIRLLVSLSVALLLDWNARKNALAQRHAAAHAEEDMNAYLAGIPQADAVAHHWAKQVREIKNELRDRRLASLFRGNA